MFMTSWVLSNFKVVNSYSFRRVLVALEMGISLFLTEFIEDTLVLDKVWDISIDENATYYNSDNFWE